MIMRSLFSTLHILSVAVLMGWLLLLYMIMLENNVDSSFLKSQNLIQSIGCTDHTIQLRVKGTLDFWRFQNCIPVFARDLLANHQQRTTPSPLKKCKVKQLLGILTALMALMYLVLIKFFFFSATIGKWSVEIFE